jgi:hypothetical protein
MRVDGRWDEKWPHDVLHLYCVRHVADPQGAILGVRPLQAPSLAGRQGRRRPPRMAVAGNRPAPVFEQAEFLLKSGTSVALPGLTELSINALYPATPECIRAAVRK